VKLGLGASLASGDSGRVEGEEKSADGVEYAEQSRRPPRGRSSLRLRQLYWWPLLPWRWPGFRERLYVAGDAVELLPMLAMASTGAVRLYEASGEGA